MLPKADRGSLRRAETPACPFTGQFLNLRVMMYAGYSSSYAGKADSGPMLLEQCNMPARTPT
ncbi:MAG TPA: hypothetical protein P5163_16740, partial [Rubrivivax sp.]|nr:hypothetical protein [Rubrivivax sp.]HRZ62234.1 hypothetical protein [Rubrivivax sp.]